MLYSQHSFNYVIQATLIAEERVQKFALKIAFKSWGDSYETLLSRSGLQQ